MVRKWYKMKKFIIEEKEFLDDGVPAQYIILKNNFKFNKYSYDSTNIEIRAGELKEIKLNSAYSIVELTNYFSRLGEKLYKIFDKYDVFLDEKEIKNIVITKLDDKDFKDVVDSIIEFCEEYGFPYSINYQKQYNYEISLGRNEKDIKNYISGKLNIIDFIYQMILLYIVIKQHKCIYNILGNIGENENINKSIIEINNYFDIFIKNKEHITLEDIYKNSDKMVFIKKCIMYKVRQIIEKYNVNYSSIYYDTKSNEYKMYRNSETTVGIAFYGMMLYAMSDKCKTVLECKNPNCINYIDRENAESKSQYCQNCNDNNTRNKLKSQNWYNNKKKEQRQ